MNVNPYQNVFEDIQALLTGTLLLAFAIVLFRQAGLLTGGTPGLTFLVYYASAIPFGTLYFLINIPSYALAFKVLGKLFALKTFCAAALISFYSEWFPRWINIESIDPVFASILGGLLAGTGLLMLIRHQFCVGGIGVLAIYLQQRHGWRAGILQMIADAIIVCGALFVVDEERVVLSILGVLVLNMVLTINHRPGRYFGQ